MSRNFICTADYPVVDTQYGKLKGFVLDGIFTFHGIEYARARRFHMPEPPASWEGVKEATSYGCVCPTMGNPIPSGEILIPHRYWPENENCLNLNIWTTSLDPAAKKPVVVWFHGGGYSDGSALEQVAYEGDALAAFGDVCVVTVNHRLNILGFFDLSAYGAEYENSGNAGMADIVASLRWIHDNIAAFGGDPGNVTVFGQSGGGGKVCTLLQCPDAEGLFHRAIMMSGGAGHMSGGAATDPREIADKMLSFLETDDIHVLEKISYRLLTRAYNKACIACEKMLSWGPKANGWYLGHPTEVGFSDYAKKVPTIVSSVISEFSAMRNANNPEEVFGEHLPEVIAAAEAAYPGKAITPLQINNRASIINFMRKRAESDPETPGYCYELSLIFSVNGGTPAWHCSDIPFVFHNAARVACCNMGEATDRLEAEMAGALVAFARTGDPNHPAMPEWKPFTTDCHATMLFDEVSSCRIDHDAALTELLTAYTPAFRFPRPLPKDEDEDQGRAWLY